MKLTGPCYSSPWRQGWLRSTQSNRPTSPSGVRDSTGAAEPIFAPTRVQFTFGSIDDGGGGGDHPSPAARAIRNNPAPTSDGPDGSRDALTGRCETFER